MALSNSTTLSDLIAEIVSPDVQRAAYATRVLRPLVRVHSLPPGAGSIVVPRFEPVSVQALNEGESHTPSAMSTVGETLTPTERGIPVRISKHALHGDPFSDLTPYGSELGKALAEDEDVQILNAMDFTTVVNEGSDGATDPVGKDHFLSALATLEGQNAHGSVSAVFHPNTWAKFRDVFADWATYSSVGKTTVEGFGEGQTNNNGYVGRPFGVPCYISTSVPLDGNGRRQNVVFTDQAVAAGFIRDIGVDVFDNVTARALDLMAWYTVDTTKLVDEYGVVLEDTEE